MKLTIKSPEVAFINKVLRINTKRQSGVSCYFYRISKRTGLKVYSRKYDALFSHRNQKKRRKIWHCS